MDLKKIKLDKERIMKSTNLKISLAYSIFFFCSASFSMAQLPEGPIGIFDGYVINGSANLKELSFNNGEYIITEAGPNLTSGGTTLSVEGSFRLIADLTIEEIDTPKERGYIALGMGNTYSSFNDFLFFMIGLFPDGSIEVAYKNQIGGYFRGFKTNTNLSAEHHTGRLELMRNGNSMEGYYIDKSTGIRTLLQRATIDIGLSVNLGLTVSSQNAGKYTKGTFRNVQFISEPITSIIDWDLY